MRPICRRLFGVSNLASKLFRPTEETRPKLAFLASRAYASQWNNESLAEAVQKDKVVVFMKGTPEEPMCGFSKAVAQILAIHGVKNFTAYNVLEDEELRKGIKEFSNWPTVPQVYLNGEFVGGCDILIQLHQSGEIIEELQKIGHISDLAETKQES